MTEIRVLESLNEIPPDQWNSLGDCAARSNPFLKHEFLHALQVSGCVGGNTGWIPQFLTVWTAENATERLTGAMPLYIKQHSYGEYVFDWAWADAYQRSGLDYYPKLLSAIPFSPITGQRILAASRADRSRLIKAAIRLAGDLSSLHVLFPTVEEGNELQALGMMLRRNVQFHWQNQGYETFEQFLSVLSSAKRKKIRQERRRVMEAGVRFRILEGKAITESDWDFFGRCYARTYREHGSMPYLNRAFFGQIGQSMPDNILLIVADLDGKPVASALNFKSREVLFGRYWGSMQHIPMLHFETCYYQAIEYCINQKIGVFEGGAQGEHKLSRGFMPVETLSAHWLAHPEFSSAVKRFLDRESAGIENYVDELNERAPLRKSAPD
jgi:predicted N-acyltransferase